MLIRVALSLLHDTMNLMIDLFNTHINGRYLFKDNILYLYNGGSSLSFKMNGDAFVVYLEHIPSPGYFYIIIDRDYENKIKVLN